MGGSQPAPSLRGPTYKRMADTGSQARILPVGLPSNPGGAIMPCSHDGLTEVLQQSLQAAIKGALPQTLPKLPFGLVIWMHNCLQDKVYIVQMRKLRPWDENTRSHHRWAVWPSTVTRHCQGPRNPTLPSCNDLGAPARVLSPLHTALAITVPPLAHPCPPLRRAAALPVVKWVVEASLSLVPRTALTLTW